MAERRMFSKRIINTARFLKMPTSTQCLYFHLGLNADDDGIVEAYTIMNSIGATEDDLKILVTKQFVQVLNNDLVTYIVDWLENNKLRPDRKVDSRYKDLLLQLNPNVKLLESRERTDRKKDNGTSNGQPMDCLGKDRIGEDRIGEDKKNKYIICPKCSTKVKKNELNKFNNVCRNCYVQEKFKIFWNEYPKRVSKERAEKAFFKICLDDVVFSNILDSLEKFKKTKDWNKEKGQYIPYPATWLNQRRWEDEIIIDVENKEKIAAVPVDKDLEDRFKEAKKDIYE